MRNSHILAQPHRASDSTVCDKAIAILLAPALPDHDGLELVPLIRAAGAWLPVISTRNATDQKAAALQTTISPSLSTRKKPRRASARL
ncbi:hypothetical protein [Sphingobium sp. EM0848]|uniref:hypothetical protein n=1 Tax=Sphingobium sp. EM0848 TaxID=2743473 RepID=UPI00159C1F6E